jgi:hypothetical protein
MYFLLVTNYLWCFKTEVYILENKLVVSLSCRLGIARDTKVSIKKIYSLLHYFILKVRPRGGYSYSLWHQPTLMKTTAQRSLAQRQTLLFCFFIEFYYPNRMAIKAPLAVRGSSA